MELIPHSFSIPSYPKCSSPYISPHVGGLLGSLLFGVLGGWDLALVAPKLLWRLRLRWGSWGATWRPLPIFPQLGMLRITHAFQRWVWRGEKKKRKEKSAFTGVGVSGWVVIPNTSSSNINNSLAGNLRQSTYSLLNFSGSIYKGRVVIPQFRAVVTSKLCACLESNLTHGQCQSVIFPI